jgi:hypothetical protein
MAQSELKVDMTKPRDRRPMIGFDIEQWRGENRLSKYDAQFALGFRNSNYYNKMCNSQLLPLATELIIRLYDEHPHARGWNRFALRELFDLMYGDALKPFKGRPDETYAKVDLGSRFCRLFGRSPGRHYQWLEAPGTRNTEELAAYADVATILAKLKQFERPGEVIERLAVKAYQLRGVNLDAEFPVPTLQHPPRREKTGRKPRSPEATPHRKAPGDAGPRHAAGKPATRTRAKPPPAVRPVAARKTRQPALKTAAAR